MRAFVLALGVAVVVAGGSKGVEPPKPQATQLHPTVSWFGDLVAALPEVDKGIIEKSAQWEKFHKDAKLPGPCPRIDFRTHFVLVQQHLGWSKVHAIWLLIDDKGEAKVEDFAMPERLFGSYGILVFPRAGIKSLNGKLLAGEL